MSNLGGAEYNAQRFGEEPEALRSLEQVGLLKAKAEANTVMVLAALMVQHSFVVEWSLGHGAVVGAALCEP